MDGTTEVNCAAAAGWVAGVAGACRKAAEEEDESSREKWAEILLFTARPAVDTWRSELSDEVESLYHPEVPPWGRDAVDQVRAAVSSRTEVDAARLTDGAGHRARPSGDHATSARVGSSRELPKRNPEPVGIR